MPGSPDTAAHSEARVFHTLDALRGVAAVGVVIFHMQSVFAPIAVAGGYLAVDLFFIMSGVVLSCAYEARFRAGMGTIDFMRLRLIRLYPLYILGLLLGIAVTLVSMSGGNSLGWDVAALLQAIMLALLFLPNLSGRPTEQLFPLNIPCWSLFFELLVNLLFVATWRLLTTRRLIFVSTLAGVAVLMATLRHGDADLGYATASMGAGFARTTFGFSVGVLIARQIRQRPRKESNGGVLLIIALFCLAAAVPVEGKTRAVWDAACILLLFPALVWCATSVEPGERLRRIATFLGLTSYAIYVLHGPVSTVLSFAGDRLPLVVAPWAGVATLGVLLSGCWIVDLVFDRPLRRQLAKLIPRPALRRAERTSNP